MSFSPHFSRVQTLALHVVRWMEIDGGPGSKTERSYASAPGRRLIIRAEVAMMRDRSGAGEAGIAQGVKKLQSPTMKRKTEREKRLAGELYNGMDPELVAERVKARKLLGRLNTSPPDYDAARRALLEDLLGKAGKDI